MKHILCFGDSNLYGTNPSGGRWPYKERWTGLLSQALGEEYRIIEEGLGGRTTAFDDPLTENRSGLKQLPLMLESHSPLDLVIISLGTNDCKTYFSANAPIIAMALEKLALLVKGYPYGEHYPIPQVLVIAPIHSIEGVEEHFASLDHASHLLSKQLGPAIKEMAEKNGLLFLDASQVAKSSLIDRLHMDREGHAALASAILPLVLKWFGDERPLIAATDQGQSEMLEGATSIDDEQDLVSQEAQEKREKQENVPKGQEDKEVEKEKKEAASSSSRGRLPRSFRFFKKRF